ncbi:hypothetical protein CY35_05G036200 [Sphagnum magellanicum]|nr:hypothetical protein CY35_05G036200 [Sphagnum magellanicum]
MGTLKLENFVKKIRYSSFWWLSTVLRIALITDDRCLFLGSCLKSQSPLLLNPTFVTVLRIALLADDRCLFLGSCLKAQSPLLLIPSFVTIDERQKAATALLKLMIEISIKERRGSSTQVEV